MQRDAIDPRMQACIDECLDCYQLCFSEAMTRAVPAGGKAVAGHHLGLLINCAELCRTTAEFMMSGSPLHARLCAACAEVCIACAESCEALGDMENCAQACRRCADRCREMAGTGGPAQGFSGSQQQNTDSPVKAPM